MVVVLLYKNINSFYFKLLFFGSVNIYFMVYYFKGVVKYYIKQMEIQSQFELTMYVTFYLLGFLINIINNDMPCSWDCLAGLQLMQHLGLAPTVVTQHCMGLKTKIL